MMLNQHALAAQALLLLAARLAAMSSSCPHPARVERQGLLEAARAAGVEEGASEGAVMMKCDLWACISKVHNKTLSLSA